MTINRNKVLIIIIAFIFGIILFYLCNIIPSNYKEKSEATKSEYDAFYIALDDNDLKTVDKIIKVKNIDINIKSSDGSTALMRASFNGDFDEVKYLLKENALVNVQCDYGRTAIINASIFGYTDIVKILINKGANIDIQDSNGNTALMIASILGHTDVVEVLLAKGTNINIKDNNGKKAIDLAIENKNITREKIIYLLTKYHKQNF